ncbi:carbohydrate kinase family protein [Roseburia sp. 1XD42-69]|uniref:carbohydrate kinase family protein n=1 Tax=Roseburia sp. 1XD42-69 TaxID=2320088 RepID=UPI000EA02062|nr:carbohydrate kinase [Roseburia sp. 1XD42-69]RKJ65363.1 carbohydrate kinase [Roseburia sp. 1XD42-69]
MEKKFDVTALGELLIDFTENGVSPQGNPILEANPGGAVCNVLSMLNQLGHTTGFIGKVGDDIFGEQLTRALEEVHIATEGLVKDREVPTTLAFVHTLPGGDRDFSFYRNPGADMMLGKEEVNVSMVEFCRIFHFGSLSMTDKISREATKYGVELAKKSGAVISFDPNLRPPLWKTLNDAKEQIDFGIRQCDILKISDNEIQWFTGEEDLKKAAEILLEKYDIKLLLLSMGKEGSMAFQGDKMVSVSGILQPDTIETTGAGDTFCGCVLHYVLEHGFRAYTETELREMLAFANAAASIVTTRKGALRVMPKREEILSTLEKISCNSK